MTQQWHSAVYFSFEFFECQYNFIQCNSYRSVTNTDISVYTFLFGWFVGLFVDFLFSLSFLSWCFEIFHLAKHFPFTMSVVCFHPAIDILLFTQLRVVGNWTAHQSVTNMFCIVNQNDVFHILVWGCHIKAKYLHVPQLLQYLTEVPARHYPLCPMVLSRCPDAADVLDFVVFWFIAEFLPFFYHIFSLVQLVLFSLSGCD